MSASPEIEPCGGCGENDPAKRCIGCFHEFTPSQPTPWLSKYRSAPTDEDPTTPAQPIELDMLRALKACVEAMHEDHPGDDSYWRAVEAAEVIIAQSGGTYMAPAVDASPTDADEKPTGWLHEHRKFGREITFDKDVAGLEEHRGWVKTPLFDSSDAIDLLKKLVTYAPDLGVDEFQEAILVARSLVAQSEDR